MAHATVLWFEEAQTPEVEPAKTFLGPFGYAVDVAVDKLVLHFRHWLELDY